MMLAALLASMLASAQPPAAPPAPQPRGPNQPARANLAEYFSADDYPMAAWRARKEGAVAFRLAIGANGRVTRCTITHSSGSTDLDEGTCAILTARARYLPATDARGRPAAGADNGRINWVLPADMPPPEELPPGCSACTPPRGDLTGYFTADDYPLAALRANEEGLVFYRAEVAADGHVTRCEVTRSSGSHALDLTTCAIFLLRIHYRPARDADGRPMAGVDTGRVNWRLPNE